LGRHRRFLKNYLLDKKLQLRYIGFVTLLSAVICAVLGSFIWYQRSYATQIIVDTLNSSEWIEPALREQIAGTLEGSDLTMIYKMVGVCVGLIVILSVFLVVMTHKVAGPLYKVGLYYEKIKEGKLPEIRDLRKGDEFQEFFRHFKKMCETMRERASADVEAYHRLVDAAKAAKLPMDGDLGHSIEELATLAKGKEDALEAGRFTSGESAD
jgi:nitrogen fixation/metabolism regulation signal transduction histidine kinase